VTNQQYSTSTCPDHVTADEILDDLAQLTGEIFATNFGMDWDTAWNLAIEQHYELTIFALERDVESALLELLRTKFIWFDCAIEWRHRDSEVLPRAVVSAMARDLYEPRHHEPSEPDLSALNGLGEKLERWQ
jgi:hypothetical protein